MSARGYFQEPDTGEACVLTIGPTGRPLARPVDDDASRVAVRTCEEISRALREFRTVDACAAPLRFFGITDWTVESVA